MKLSFCQNDPPMGESFWQKDSLSTHILFELWLITLLRFVQFFLKQTLKELGFILMKKVLDSQNLIKHVVNKDVNIRFQYLIELDEFQNTNSIPEMISTHTTTWTCTIYDDMLPWHIPF